MNKPKALSITRVRRLCLWAGLLAVLVMVGCAEPITPTLDMTPASYTLVAGQALQLTVTRHFPGGSVENVTTKVAYTTSDRAVAVVSERGVVTAGSVVGPVIVKASDPGSDAAVVATFLIMAAEITSIDVTPAPAKVLAPGDVQSFTATARLDNGTTRDVTREVSWSSTNQAAALVGDTPLDKGVVRAVTTGEATIVATDGATRVQGRSLVFVSGQSPALAAIFVTPDPALVSVGKTVSLRADGLFEDGSTKDLTRSVTWSSSRPDLASVDGVGVVTGVLSGDATITAVGPEPFTQRRGSVGVKVVP